ncbi:MAG: hypothetical protein LAP61_18695 [Acidobacteriia bacterium]|nr:hypothetical protein [Terriglobia bacterium]
MNPITRLYKILLRLYPRDCRAWCAREMLDAFEKAASDHRAQGLAALARFGLAELSGLLVEAGAAWIAKFTSSRYMRGFWIPTTMRRPGQSPEDWCPPGARVLSDVLEAQRRVDLNLHHMMDAISDRDFKRARFYSEEDLRTRNR